eukprot:gene11208-18829_t
MLPALNSPQARVPMVEPSSDTRSREHRRNPSCGTVNAPPYIFVRVLCKTSANCIDSPMPSQRFTIRMGTQDVGTGNDQDDMSRAQDIFPSSHSQPKAAEAAQRDAALAASREEKAAGRASWEAAAQEYREIVKDARLLFNNATVRAEEAASLNAGRADARREAKQAQAEAASMPPALAAAARHLRVARAIFIDAGEAARRAELEASVDSTSPALAASAQEIREILKDARALFKNAAAACDRRAARALFIDAGRAALRAEAEALADSTSPALAAAVRESREVVKAATVLFKNATMRLERAAKAAPQAALPTSRSAAQTVTSDIRSVQASMGGSGANLAAVRQSRHQRHPSGLHWMLCWQPPVQR